MDDWNNLVSDPYKHGPSAGQEEMSYEAWDDVSSFLNSQGDCDFDIIHQLNVKKD